MTDSPPPLVAPWHHPPALSFVTSYDAICILVRGKLCCRESIKPGVPFSSDPVVAGLESLDARQLALGLGYGCAVLHDGTAACWGDNQLGQLGANLRDEQHPAPAPVANLRGIEKLFAGFRHACAVVDGGRVACWGDNEFGQTGSSTRYLEGARELVDPQLVPGVDGVVDMALGTAATFAVQSTGAMITWGGRLLKDDPSTPRWNEQPRVIARLEGTTALAAQGDGFCGIRRDALICWGVSGAFGATRGEAITIPIEHPRRVHLSERHGCAIDAGGFVWCFGQNLQGELGVPPPAEMDARYTVRGPIKVPGVTQAVDVACQGETSCALTASDEVFCWGHFDGASLSDDIHPPTRIAL